MKSNNKSVLILTGAGITSPWNGKKTNEITKIILDKDRFYSDLKSKLTASINRDINFEDIVNSIETLFLYYRGKQDYIDSEMPIIFRLNSELKSFIENHNTEDIPSLLADKFYNAIECIIEIIREYSLTIKTKTKINDLLVGYLNDLNKRFILRTYTTNYDRLFIEACKNSQNGKTIKFFDGFPELTDYYPTYNNNIDTKEYLKRFSLKHVLSNRNINCSYNLHGSVYWDWRHSSPFEQNEFSQFFCSEKTIELELHGDALKLNSIQTGNPKEPFLLSPIITGYKKTQRLSLSPFNALSNSFLEDCYECDIWFIIGYSFSDNHLNNLMKTAIIQRKEMPKIIWVTKDEKAINQNSMFLVDSTFQDIFDSKKYSRRDDYTYVKDYLFKSIDEKIFFFFDGFEAFLQKMIWRDIL